MHRENRSCIMLVSRAKPGYFEDSGGGGCSKPPSTSTTTPNSKPSHSFNTSPTFQKVLRQYAVHVTRDRVWGISSMLGCERFCGGTFRVEEACWTDPSVLKSGVVVSYTNLQYTTSKPHGKPPINTPNHMRCSLVTSHDRLVLTCSELPHASSSRPPAPKNRRTPSIILSLRSGREAQSSHVRAAARVENTLVNPGQTLLLPQQGRLSLLRNNSMRMHR